MARTSPVRPVEDRLFARYRPLPGVPDELAGADGLMRPAWADLIGHMSGRSRAAIERDFVRGEQHLADAGVFFRRYGDEAGAGRDWPYSPVPVMLSAEEWREISAALAERAELLETVVADLYGENRLVADGHLPAALIAQSPEWLRPMVGVRPRSGHFLHFVAFEIGRGPDGRWWVLSDLTDAPSGAGFALENRVATRRVFPELFGRLPIRRLSGFFLDFRDALDGLRQGPASRAGILTPGALNDTYYEQAYIARYLGMSLFEGADLVVDGGQLKARTVKGLVPVEVLWRRMDGVWADPLELREDSRLGAPGLLSAVRQGHVSMVNALGVGILEMQALMAFLPAISVVLTGAPLSLPNVATWWCGGAAELAHVRANASRMMIGPAMSSRMPYETNAVHAVGGQLRGAIEGDLDRWLTGNAAGLMAKELVTLSTTPVYENGALVPRPMTLRVFLARTRSGWQAMPGGFARIGSGRDTTAISMRRGGSVADVWVLGDRDDSVAAAPKARPEDFVRIQAGALPSRAADNLFWLGRYVERSEGVARMVRAYHSRLGEAATPALLQAIRRWLAAYGTEAEEGVPLGLRQTLGSAVVSASQIRDRFSVDGWAALKDMEKSLGRLARTVRPGGDAAHAMGVILRKLAGFSGLVHENMYRAAGWQFLTIGRSLERAAMVTDLLAAMTGAEGPEGGLDLAIEYGDSTIVHRQRYGVMTSRESVIDQLALDELNPRSARFHLDMLRRRLDDLSADSPPGLMTGFERGLITLQSSFAVHSVVTLDSRALRKAHRDILELSTLLQSSFLL